MTEKEIGEIRRSLKADRNAITTVCGCYADATGEIIARFSESPALMSAEESDQYFSIFRRTLSGTPARNLLEIAFSNEQVLSGEEHALLTTLKKSELKDADALDRFFEKAARAVDMDGNFVILLTYNKYDVPFKSTDGARVDGESCEVFSHILCSICPVKMTRAALSYEASKKSFHHANGILAVGAPELGFMFPAFDNRQTNIYSALLYTRSASDAHESFTDALFRKSISMTATAQNEVFRSVLAEALEEDCSFRVAKRLHESICARIEEHKESREEEPLSISKYQVQEILEDCGIDAQKAEDFTKTYTESFGAGTELAPKNIVDPKRFELRTPDVVIKVAPGRSDLVQTRVIDGDKYILIRANEGVELNGLNVVIEENQA